MTASFQLSILSSCSFDSCHHVDSTHPRGPFGFVQLLLLRLRARTTRVSARPRVQCIALATADVGKENGPVCRCLVVNESTQLMH